MDSSKKHSYTPYGAYELKAKYQRNMIISNAVVTTVIAAIVAVSMLLSGEKAKAEPKDGKEPIEMLFKFEPISIKRTPPPTTDVKPPARPDIDGGILVPVPDEEYFEDDTEIETIDSFYSLDEMEYEPGNNDTGFGDGLEDGSDGAGSMPGITSFFGGERIPEFIKMANPKYPRLARQAGLEGTVWIAAHVDINGSVIEAKIYKSSEIEILDDAALKAAYKNIFRPAIQNKLPVKLWVAYKVVFVLNR